MATVPGSGPGSTTTVNSTCCWEVPSGTSMSVATQVVRVSPTRSAGSKVLLSASSSDKLTEVRASSLPNVDEFASDWGMSFDRTRSLSSSSAISSRLNTTWSTVVGSSGRPRRSVVSADQSSVVSVPSCTG
jgi:hypothetical protein